MASSVVRPQTRLVVFDLGRVLVRICDDFQQAFECAGIAPPPTPDPDRMLQIHDLTCRCDEGKIDINGFCESAAPILGLSSQQIRKMSDSFLRGPYPGAAELVNELADRGVMTACLSNTNDSHWEIMNGAGYPLRRLTHRFASHIVGCRKPGSEIYAHLERATGVEPRYILFFDDVQDNVAAAIERGWAAHRIDPALDDPIGQVRAVLSGRDLLADRAAKRS